MCPFFCLIKIVRVVQDPMSFVRLWKVQAHLPARSHVGSPVAKAGRGLGIRRSAKDEVPSGARNFPPTVVKSGQKKKKKKSARSVFALFGLNGKPVS